MQKSRSLSVKRREASVAPPSERRQTTARILCFALYDIMYRAAPKKGSLCWAYIFNKTPPLMCFKYIIYVFAVRVNHK